MFGELLEVAYVPLQVCSFSSLTLHVVQTGVEITRCTVGPDLQDQAYRRDGQDDTIVHIRWIQSATKDYPYTLPSSPARIL